MQGLAWLYVACRLYVVLLASNACVGIVLAVIMHPACCFGGGVLFITARAFYAICVCTDHAYMHCECTHGLIITTCSVARTACVDAVQAHNTHVSLIAKHFIAFNALIRPINVYPVYHPVRIHSIHSRPSSCWIMSSMDDRQPIQRHPAAIHGSYWMARAGRFLDDLWMSVSHSDRPSRTGLP